MTAASAATSPGTMAAPAPLHVGPLPPFASAAGALAEALPSLAPLARVRVSEVAQRRFIEVAGRWIRWRPDVAPYMTEPMDLTTSRRFDSIAFVGPARSSKSEALVVNPLVHAILAQPRAVAVFSPRKQAAQEWSMGMLDQLIANSPEIRARLARGKGGDNVFQKRFRGGCRLTVDWPVRDKLAQRSLSLVIGTDYDAFDDDIGGDGAAFALMRKRTEAAMSRGMTIVESSPRKPILLETWRPGTPHEAPPAEGIVGIYQRGSRGRLYWTCPGCGERFRPEWETLQIPDEGSPAERGAGTVMVAPCCGSVIAPETKAAMNAAAMWLHEDADGSAVPIEALRREVATASYWLPGPAAALASWSRIVARYLEAEEEYEQTGNEQSLKSVVNVELGMPWLSRARTDTEALSEEVLRAGASAHEWGVAPAGTAFVAVAVDVQPGRFVVQVEAVQPGLERVIIDRFDLFTPPPAAPGAAGRRIDPARYGEDWDALLELASRAWPVDGADYGLRPLIVVVDSQGEPGVTPNAYAFWRRARRSHRGRFYVLRGEGGLHRKRAELRYPESAHAGKAFAARDVPILRIGTDRMKDEVAASLLRREDGGRKLHVPAGAPDEVFAELAAERRDVDGWEKRAGVRRNEALDLAGYVLGAVVVIEAEAIDWTDPPRWALSGPRNAMAVRADEPAEADGAPEVKAAAPEGMPGEVVRPGGAGPSGGQGRGAEAAAGGGRAVPASSVAAGWTVVRPQRPRGGGTLGGGW